MDNSGCKFQALNGIALAGKQKKMKHRLHLLALYGTNVLLVPLHHLVYKSLRLADHSTLGHSLF